MQKKKVLLALFTLLLFGIVSSKAQDYFKGKVTLKDGSVVEGFVRDASDAKNTSACYFRETLKADVKKYLPEDILSYQIEDRKKFSSFKIKPAEGDSVQKLLQILVGGELNLMHLREDGVNYYYIKYAGKPLTEIVGQNRVKVNGVNYVTEGNYKGALKAGFSRCPQNIDRLKFYQDDLIETVKRYNLCGSVNNQTFDYKRPKNAIYMGIRGGFSTVDFSIGSNSNAYYSYYYNASNPSSSTLGLSLTSQVNQIHKRVTAEMDFLLMTTKFKHYYNGSYDSDVSIQSLQVPLSIQYNLLPTAFSPYLMGGAFFNFPISESVAGNSNSKLFPEAVNGKDSGILYGVGLKLTATRGILYIEWRDQTIHHSKVNSKEAIVGNYNSILLGVAYRLK